MKANSKNHETKLFTVLCACPHENQEKLVSEQHPSWIRIADYHLFLIWFSQNVLAIIQSIDSILSVITEIQTANYDVITQGTTGNGFGDNRKAARPAQCNNMMVIRLYQWIHVNWTSRDNTTNTDYFRTVDELIVSINHSISVKEPDILSHD